MPFPYNEFNISRYAAGAQLASCTGTVPPCRCGADTCGRRGARGTARCLVCLLCAGRTAGCGIERVASARVASARVASARGALGAQIASRHSLLLPVQTAMIHSLTHTRTCSRLHLVAFSADGPSSTAYYDCRKARRD